MNTFIDQTGQTITIRKKPKRIISIVPSQSELLWDLGLQRELVGITKFCVHPKEMFNTVERVGGTKKLDIDKIRQLKPDLIIGNKEENEKEQIELLRKEFPVWMSDIYNLSDACQMIKNIGAITEKKTEAEIIIKTIKKKFLLLNKPSFIGNKVAYLIWYGPHMVAASNTFIDFMLNKLGFENVFKNLERYPEIPNETLKNSKPDYILLSSEPFPFKEKHISEFKSICPDAKVILVDGEMFSWYGSRLIKAPEYFNSLSLNLNS